MKQHTLYLIYLITIIHCIISVINAQIIIDDQDDNFINRYHVIGPFPIGEREEGVDTLENYGGVFNIPVGDDTMYPSELGTNGAVGWQLFNATTSNQQTTSLSIDFSDTINWNFLVDPISWSVYMWYGYAIGEFTVPLNSTYIFNCQGIIKYYIRPINNSNNNNNNEDIQEFIGDFFGYGVGQQVIELQQFTTYQLIIRMQSSVRRNLSPQTLFTCSIINQFENNNNNEIMIIEKDNLVPSIVGGRLGGVYGSITILNIQQQSTLNNIDVVLVNDSTSNIQIEMLDNSSVNGILPGQRYGLVFVMIQDDDIIGCPILELYVRVEGIQVTNTTIQFNCTEWGNPYSFTFLDYDQTAQYAVAFPPIANGSMCIQDDGSGGGSGGSQCHSILATHGAGVSVIDTYGWYTAYPQQPDKWIVYPSGRRPWGYDWQGASRLDALTALEYFANALPGVPDDLKTSLAIDTSKILFSGHSMGAYGCWTMVAHLGDRAMGGACAAGFAKLQDYVYYNTRPSFSHLDSILKGLLLASIADGDADLHTSNMVGVPLIARYGGNDTIVSPWHSRRMARLVDELGGNISAVQISEVPGQGHWFNGMLDAPVMADFYASSSVLPSVPLTLTVTVSNPAVSQSRANLLILQKDDTSRVARIKVVQQLDPVNGTVTAWILTTQNVRRFGVTSSPSRDIPAILIIDGVSIQLALNRYPSTSLLQIKKKQWILTNDQGWVETERSPLTYGPIKQIFEKHFTIVYGTMDDSMVRVTQSSAVWLSNYFSIYGRGSPNIIADTEFIPPSTCDSTTNYILIGTPSQNMVTSKYSQHMPIQFDDTDSTLFTIGDDQFQFTNGSGLTFLSPNQCGQGLLLVIGASDNQGLLNAMHSLPIRSGETVPDYLFISNQWKSIGLGSIITTGYFNSNWLISLSSSYLSLN